MSSCRLEQHKDWIFNCCVEAGKHQDTYLCCTLIYPPVDGIRQPQAYATATRKAWSQYNLLNCEEKSLVTIKLTQVWREKPWSRYKAESAEMAEMFGDGTSVRCFLTNHKNTFHFIHGECKYICKASTSVTSARIPLRRPKFSQALYGVYCDQRWVSVVVHCWIGWVGP